MVFNFGRSSRDMTGQGKGVIDACLQEGVKQLIYSGLESAEKMYGFVVGTPFW